MKAVKLFQISVDPLDLNEVSKKVISMVSNENFALVVTPNVDQVVTLHKDREFLRIYQQAKLIVADGMPLVWLSKLLPGNSLPERVTGADLFEKVCSLAANKGLSIALVGGNPGVAEQAASMLSKRYPGLQVVGVYSPPFGFESDQIECNKIAAMVKAWRADILFVGLGSPKQEKFSFNYLRHAHSGPLLCVGAAFDFSACVNKRAPDWVQRLGMEWLWRMCQEPDRLVKRYLVRDSVFFLYALRELFRQWAAVVKPDFDSG